MYSALGHNFDKQIGMQVVALAKTFYFLYLGYLKCTCLLVTEYAVRIHAGSETLEATHAS